MINNLFLLLFADNQNYLNYNQAAPQGRNLAGYSSRNGFIPVRQQQQQHQNQQPGSYQSQEVFLDNYDARFPFQQYPVSFSSPITVKNCLKDRFDNQSAP